MPNIRVQRIIEGLEILEKYDGNDVCAEHDEIYAGPSVDVSADDAKRLNEIGWIRAELDQGWKIFV